MNIQELITGKVKAEFGNLEHIKAFSTKQAALKWIEEKNKPK